MADGKQVVDVAGDLHARCDQDYEVVTDAFEIGDEVRREHDAHAVLGHGPHERLQELPPCEGVEAGDRLVEYEELRALGNRQGEGELRPLAAREGARSLRHVEL
jgi:hypothetical protein